MRVFIPGLILGLAALWPQNACSRARASVPPPPAITWTGPLATIQADCLREYTDSARHQEVPPFELVCPPFLLGENDSNQTPVVPCRFLTFDYGFRRNPFDHPVVSWSGLCGPLTVDFVQDDGYPQNADRCLIIVRIKGTNSDLTSNRVALLAGNKVLAEADTSYGLAIFSLKGDLCLKQDWMIKVKPTAVPEYVYFGWPSCCWGSCDGSRSGPLPTFIIPPERVEIIMFAAVASRISELPGFLSKLVTASKESLVRKRFSLELAHREQTDFESRTTGMEKEEFRTPPFSLNGCPRALVKSRSQTTPKSLWIPNPRPSLVCDWELLLTGQYVDTETMRIQPVDWRKGTAGDSLDPGLCDECRLLVPLDEQKPTLIIIHEFPNPLPKAEPDEQFRFLNGLTIGGVGLTF